MAETHTAVEWMAIEKEEAMRNSCFPCSYWTFGSTFKLFDPIFKNHGMTWQLQIKRVVKANWHDLSSTYTMHDGITAL